MKSDFKIIFCAFLRILENCVLSGRIEFVGVGDVKLDVVLIGVVLVIAVDGVIIWVAVVVR